MALDLKTPTDPDRSASAVRAWKGRPLLELAVACGLILATIWTPMPAQRWLDWIAVLWIFLTTLASFPGWHALGFRRRGFFPSLWVVFAAMLFAAGAITVAGNFHTLWHPTGARGWIMSFGGYTVWSFSQQFLLQGYFLFRFLRILPRREWAALAAAVIFAAAHLPNPILTVLTLFWGACACFVFLRCRNVYPLAMAHAILGITVAITVPGPVVGNMRVGLEYVKYQQPRMHAVRPESFN